MVKDIQVTYSTKVLASFFEINLLHKFDSQGLSSIRKIQPRGLV